MTALSILKLLPYPAAHHPSGSVIFKNQNLLELNELDIRRVRGDDITIIFQEPMTSLNPLHTVEKQINEALLLHRGISGRKRGCVPSICSARLAFRSAGSIEELPASAVWWPAPARDDRDCARQ